MQILLTQAPNGALSAKRCVFSSPLPIANPKPSLFSHPKPKFNSKDPKKRLNLTTAKHSLSNPSPQPFGNEETVLVEEKDIPLEGVIQFEKTQLSSPLNSWGRVAFLAGGDVLFLLLFAAIGRFRHGFAVFDIDTLHTADPFIAGWFLGAYFLGGYDDDGRGKNGYSKAVIAAAKSWAVGIPLGLIIRVATSGHIPQSSFVFVTMGTTAILLIGWRALLYALFPNDQSKRSDVYRRGSPFELLELLTSLVRRW
ncbi:uncharacterized protein LOC143876130 [Tasmannia lanceolata]|uniref:uncharacterized protein LOC143876130 n=1 Tax=Tasmannia lanceolata TaxID=3420 RepID=UPI004064BD36